MNNPYPRDFRTVARQTSRSFLSIVWLIVLAGYLMVSAGQAVYRSYESQKLTSDLQTQLDKDNQEKERLQALVIYYRTDSFKEKEMRRTLLLKRSNEKVYALPESGLSKTAEEEATNNQNQSKDITDPTWQQWVDYLLHLSPDK
jgi:hypothetical protein